MNTNISYICDGRKAFFHLPGLFEFYEFYKVFLPLFYEHREYFYDWCDIGSIYGAPADCLWGGGRAGFGDGDAREVFLHLCLNIKYLQGLHLVILFLKRSTYQIKDVMSCVNY